MANNKSNVSVGKPKIAGAIFRAPLGTTLPTAASGALDAAFKAMGYVSADGLTNANSISTNNIKAWGGDTVLVSQTDKTDTMACTLIESLNSDVLAAVFGSENVAGTLQDGISISINADAQEEAVWVVDMLLNGNTAKRIVVPCGVISALADIVYKDDEVIGYGITISCLPDDSGNTHYEYILAS